MVILGAGFAGLGAVQALKGAGLSITLVDQRNHHLFQPLLYQVATTILSPSEIAWPIRRLMRQRPDVRCLMATVTGIADGHVLLAHAAPLPFDTLILATGSQPAYFNRPDWAAVAPGLKSLEDATLIRRRILLAFEEAEVEADPARRAALLTFAIIGGGPTGVELAGIIIDLARKTLRPEFRWIDTRETRVVLIEAADRLLATFPPRLSAYAETTLRRMGVEVRLGQPVTDLTAGGVHIGATFIPSATLVWAAGVAATPAAAWLGLAPARGGRLAVGADLSLPGQPHIFVAGDLAAPPLQDGQPIPQLAPAAKQQGAYIGRLLRAHALGLAPPPPFRYAHQGDLATIGKRAAVVRLGRLQLKGWLAWWVWGLAHIFFLIGTRNRVAVAWSWLWTHLRGQHAARLVIDPPPLAGNIPPQAGFTPRQESEDRMDQSNDARDVFITGLRNAHAVESQALSVMQPQINRLETYPELKALLQQHYRETEGQIARLDQIFASLEESPSGVKDTLMSVMGSVQAMGHSIASDEILKNTMADYMFEHFEIAAYTSLISMATFLGYTTFVPLLEQSLEEERRTAAILGEALPRITEKFMQRTAAGLKADS